MSDDPSLSPAGAKHRKPHLSEQVMSNVKTLLWVIPLTVLIWIYAEREQMAPPTELTAQFEIKNSDPNRVIWLPAGEHALTLTVQGPQSHVDRVRDDLTRGDPASRLPIEIDPNLTPGQTYSLNLLKLISDDPRFVVNGVSVLKCTPEILQVSIDQIVEKDAAVIAPSNIPSLQWARFSPEQVKLRGPSRLLDPLAKNAPLTVEADLLGLREMAVPGQHADIPVRLKPPGGDDRLSLAPDTVKVTLFVKEADATATLTNVPIFLLAPSLILDAYRVKYTPVVPAVTVIGPPDQIKALQDGSSTYKPRAALELTDDDLKDLKNPKPKSLRYLNLPPGVRVSDTSLNQTITFTVVERGG